MKASDCFYFMTSRCARGSECAYRHSEAAKNSSVICNRWRNGAECEEDCPYRHSDYSSKEKKKESCYWETRGGCKKSDCPYFHNTKEIPSLLDLSKLDYCNLEKMLEESNGRVVVKSIEDIMKELRNLDDIF